MPTSLAPRPSAADRERAARRLRSACEADRLSLETFARRLDHVYSVRTRAELDELLADLAEPGLAGRAVLAATRSVSRWSARVAAAWREPRTPRLVLPTRADVVVGRSRDCDCVLSDPTVSRQHASLTHADGSWLLRDLGSVNGTYVNGWRVVDAVEVRPGDEVAFGAATYRLHALRNA